MKFFSDLGSCYRPTTTAAAAEEVAELPTPLTASRVVVVVGGGGGGGGRGTRSKSIKSKSESGLHWQPTLSAISENGVAAAAPKGGQQRAQGHQVLKKSPVKGRAGIKSRSSSSRDQDYYRESSMVMAMPAFSPTPFMI